MFLTQRMLLDYFTNDSTGCLMEKVTVVVLHPYCLKNSGPLVFQFSGKFLPSLGPSIGLSFKTLKLRSKLKLAW
jgi:hypothetical protein